MEHIKELWNKDEINETPEISVERQKQIRLPLEKIRANMKKEYKLSIITFPSIFLILFFLKGFYQMSLFLILVGLALLISAYYFMKFRMLYQKINTQSLDTYHNLLNLRYELVLNTELYKSYFLCFVPLLFCGYVLFFYTEESLLNVVSIFISTIIASVFMYLCGKIWLKEMYGKYIVQISELVSQMNNEKDDFQYDRTTIRASKYISFFEKTQPFFTKKFGRKGIILHVLFWIIIFYIAAFILGFIAGFIMVMFNN